MIILVCQRFQIVAVTVLRGLDHSCKTILVSLKHSFLYFNVSIMSFVEPSEPILEKEGNFMNIRVNVSSFLEPI